MVEPVFREAATFDLIHFHADYFHFSLSLRFTSSFNSQRRQETSVPGGLECLVNRSRWAMGMETPRILGEG
jgi:hypothetical protein